jgi:hypothetical protein
VGGTPVLGYDIAVGGGRLVVNPEEARRVQEIFALYLQHPSLEAVLDEMEVRQWTTKRWRTREGKPYPGRPFTKASLERLLRNMLYLGQVAHQGEIYAGEQEAIIDQPVWERVQARLVKVQEESDVAAGPGKAKKARPPSAVNMRTERVPRITRLLALALKFEELIRSGEVSNYAVLARLARVSRSRVTQMTSLLSLAPDIQEEILFLRPAEAKQLRISEPSLRKLTATLLWNKQREQWRDLRRSVRPVAD